MSFNTVFDNIPAVSAVLRAIGNEKRMMIIAALLHEEIAPTELAPRVGLSTAALSQHLNILKDLGLVTSRRQAQLKLYSCKSPVVIELFKHIASMIEKNDNQIAYREMGSNRH